MWSNNYVDDEDIAEDEDDDYLGQKEQVPFTLNEAGGNTYEAGYMSSIGFQAPQQQQVEMGIVMPVARPDIQKQSAPLKLISTGAAHHVDKQSGSKKTSQQKNMVLPVVSKGHAGDVQNVIITTRGNSNHAATKGEPKESTGTK